MELKGIAYFPCPTNNPTAVNSLEWKFKLKGFATYIKILQKLYGKEGYFFKMTDDAVLELKHDLTLAPTDNIIADIVEYCLEKKIFDKKLYTKYQILTSNEIQKEYLRAVRKRTDIVLIDKYLLPFARTWKKKAEENRKKAEEMEETAEVLDKENKIIKNKKDNKYKNNNNIYYTHTRENKDNKYKNNIVNYTNTRELLSYVEVFKKYYKSFFEMYEESTTELSKKRKEVGTEIVYIMAGSLLQAREQGFVFKVKTYTDLELAKIYSRLNPDMFIHIAYSIVQREESIESREAYILETVLNNVSTQKRPKLEEEKMYLEKTEKEVLEELQKEAV